MGTRKEQHHSGQTSGKNTLVTINGEKYRLFDPIHVSLGMSDILTPMFGLNTALHLFLFGKNMEFWYHYPALIIGALGLIASIWFLLKMFWETVTKSNTGRVPSLVKIY